MRFPALAVIVAVAAIQVAAVPSHALQQADLGAFFAHPGDTLDGVEYRVVGVTMIGRELFVFVKIRQDVNLPREWRSRLRGLLQLTGQKIEIRLVSEISSLDLVDMERSALAKGLPVDPGTGVAFKENGLHGTIGCRLTNGPTFLLSNNHVLANTDRVATGEPSFQGQLRIGTLAAVQCLSRRTHNRIDAALACTTEQCVTTRTPDFAFAPETRRADPKVKVKKRGNKTQEVRNGEIESTGGLYEVKLTDGNAYCFADQILVRSEDPRLPFAEDGDSGAVAVDGDNQPVGLFFARIKAAPQEGGRKTAGFLMNPMNAVMTTLGDLLPGGMRTAQGLSIDTQESVKTEISCEASLQSACSFTVPDEQCEGKRKREQKALEAIEAVIDRQSASGDFISLENRPCAGGIVGVLADSNNEPGLLQSLTTALAGPGKGVPVLLFREGVTMDEVLERWRSTQPMR